MNIHQSTVEQISINNQTNAIYQILLWLLPSILFEFQGNESCRANSNWVYWMLFLYQPQTNHRCCVVIACPEIRFRHHRDQQKCMQCHKNWRFIFFVAMLFAWQQLLLSESIRFKLRILSLALKSLYNMINLSESLKLKCNKGIQQALGCLQHSGRQFRELKEAGGCPTPPSSSSFVWRALN